MIPLKSPRELELMRAAGRIAGEALRRVGALVAPGVTTGHLDEVAHAYILSQGAAPSFLGYGGFPRNICVSVNDEVIHGIPGKRKLREGDIVGVDIGACYQGFHGDCAATFAVGAVSDAARQLIDATRGAFYAALQCAYEGRRISDISAATERHVTAHGYTVVREYTGHGIGQALHEDPEVPNFARAERGPRLLRGMTICIEPMVMAGGPAIRILPDRWTVVTADGSPAAHYEHTVLITADEPELLTDVGGL